MAAARLPLQTYVPDKHPANRLQAMCCVVTAPRTRVYKKRDGKPGGSATNVTVLMPQNDTGYVTRMTVDINGSISTVLVLACTHVCVRMLSMC